MADSDAILKKRFRELAEKSYSRGIFTFTDFLSLAEQSVLMSCLTSRDFPRVKCELYGGNESCERRMARFGDAEELGWSADFPISCVTVAPKNGKFADALGHRDFLGALMSLGIKRETTGDIFIRDNAGYVFCNDRMADFIAANLDSVRHTSVSCSVSSDCPDGLTQKVEEREINTASERVDAVVCAVYRLSRGAGGQLFDAQRVFVNSRLVTSPGTELREGDIVSVRGFGRFKYCGVTRGTKKGRLFVKVEVYRS